ncbi:MAG: hypothetical protein L0Y36_05860 [Planctomycetales bacterium]|nr:hypothetical protein [Planctomycetales bacterium]
MLKTLQITSLIAVILAVCGVAGIVLWGLKGDPEIRALIDKPGAIEELQATFGQQQKGKEDAVSPLVSQAKKFALRIDPPPPPEPPKPKVDPAVARAQAAAAGPPTPPVQASLKVDLLATVCYETAPEKSLALVSAGSKQEWFRQGEKVGQHEVKEIRNGSVIFTQGGTRPQEVFVPAETGIKSLLKSDQTASAAPRGPIPGPSPIPTPAIAAPSQPAETAVTVSQAGAAPVVRSSATADSTRADVAERIRRVRSGVSEQVPQDPNAGGEQAPPAPAHREPTPEEQKASVESAITGIEGIMNSQTEGLSEEDRRNEQKIWAELLETLKAEKQALEKAPPPKESAPPAPPAVPQTPTDKPAVKSKAANAAPAPVKRVTADSEDSGSAAGPKENDPAPPKPEHPAKPVDAG